jgi:YesN/AraC family two-component response regulator
MGENVRGQVLIAEDELDLGMSLVEFAKLSGFEVKHAANGQQALQLLATEPFDVIVSDIAMPGLTGLQILEKVSSVKHQIPFVIISAFGLGNVVLSALRMGAFDFLEKPFQPADFINILSEAARVSEELQSGYGIERIVRLPAHMRDPNLIARESREGQKLIKDFQATMPAHRDWRQAHSRPRVGNLAIDQVSRIRDEVALQLRQVEKTLISLKQTDSGGWDMGYLFRTMRQVANSMATLGEHDCARLAAAMENGLAVFRVRKHLLSTKLLNQFRQGAKLLSLAAGTPKSEFSTISDLDSQVKALADELEGELLPAAG